MNPVKNYLFLCCLAAFGSGAVFSALIGDNEDSSVEEGGASAGNNMEWLYESPYKMMHKRRIGGPSDPRSLFANIYGNYGEMIGYRKRLNLPSQIERNSLYYGPNPMPVINSRKRGLGDRYDPRNLFRAIYGFYKRK